MGLDEPIELSKDRKVSAPIALILACVVGVVAITRWIDSKVMVIDSVPSLARAVGDLTHEVTKLHVTVDQLSQNTEKLTEAVKHDEGRAALPGPQLSNRRPSAVQAGGRRENVR
jgi:hypothetical protein